MRVKVNLTKIKRNGVPNSVLSATPEYFIEGAELEFAADGDGKLVIYNPMSKTSYVTDFAYSGVSAVLTAAAATGGHFVLT